MQLYEQLLVIVLLALVTQLVRSLPFILFPEHRPLPNWMNYFASKLPFASIGLLLIYALRTPLLTNQWPVAEALTLGTITLVHGWWRNTLLSIAIGVFVYLVLVNT